MQTGVVYLAIIGTVFTAFYVLPSIVAVIVGAVAALCTAAYSFRILANIVSLEEMPRPVRLIFNALKGRLRSSANCSDLGITS